MDSPCALECSRALSTLLATIRTTIYIVRGRPGTLPALQCALLSQPVSTCIIAPIGRAQRPAAPTRRCAREQRFACWPSSSLIDGAARMMLASKSLAAAEPPAPATTTLALRNWICARARPAFQWERSGFDAPGPRRRRSSSSGSLAVHLLNPPLAQPEGHVASCLASTGGTAASVSTIVKNGPSQPTAFAAALLDPGHSGANSPRIP